MGACKDTYAQARMHVHTLTHTHAHVHAHTHTHTHTHKRRCEGVIGAASEGLWAIVKSGKGNSSDKTDSLNENFIPPSNVVRLLDCSIVRLLKDISGMS